MTEHRRNIMVTDCLEANIYYNQLAEKSWVFSRRNTLPVTANTVIAEAYLMRSETLTNYESR
jgi:hypothetical protein